MNTPRLVLAGTLLLGVGCGPVSPATQLSKEMYFTVYWDAARQCERQFSSVRVAQLYPEGRLIVEIGEGNRASARSFIECYWQGIAQRVEARRRAGQPVPESLTSQPPVDVRPIED